MTADLIPPPPNFELHLTFGVPADRLFAAIATEDGTKKWWTLSSKVSENIGGQSAFYFTSAGFHAVMKTLQRKSPRLLEWECIDSKHSEDTGHTNLHDWEGTRIRFEIRDLGDGRSQLDFTHTKLPQLECYEDCRKGWNFFLNESLRGYLETGVGQPWDQDSPMNS